MPRDAAVNRTRPANLEDIEDSFPELIGRARQGELDALTHLFHSCQPHLLYGAQRAFPRALRSKVDPWDLVQETMLIAHRDLSRFKGTERKQFLNWMGTIMNNKSLTAWRRYAGTQRRSIHREVPLVGVVGTNREPMERWQATNAQLKVRELYRELAESLRRLPRDMKKVIELRQQGLTFPEIGSRMQRSSAAARKLWTRAIARLQREHCKGAIQQP